MRIVQIEFRYVGELMLRSAILRKYIILRLAMFKLSGYKILGAFQFRSLVVFNPWFGYPSTLQG